MAIDKSIVATHNGAQIAVKAQFEAINNLPSKKEGYLIVDKKTRKIKVISRNLLTRAIDTVFGIFTKADKAARSTIQSQVIATVDAAKKAEYRAVKGSTMELVSAQLANLQKTSNPRVNEIATALVKYFTPNTPQTPRRGRSSRIRNEDVVRAANRARSASPLRRRQVRDYRARSFPGAGDYSYDFQYGEVSDLRASPSLSRGQRIGED